MLYNVYANKELFIFHKYLKAIKSVYFDWFVWSKATQLTRSNYESDIFNSLQLYSHLQKLLPMLFCFTKNAINKFSSI